MVYELSNMTLEERRKVIGLEEKRSDVILYGAAILQAFFQISGRDRVWVSEADNMEGYLMWKKETDTKF